MPQVSPLPRALHSIRFRRAWSTVGVCLAVVACVLHAQPPGDGAAPASVPSIVPTAHVPIPSSASEAWMVPDETAAVPNAWRHLGQAARAVADGAPADALRLIDVAALANSPLAAYAQFYRGRALSALDRADDAARVLEAARVAATGTALAQDVTVQVAVLAENRGDAQGALRAYQQTLEVATRDRDGVLASIVRMATAAGDREAAVSAARRLFYEFPASERVADVRQVVAESRLQIEPARAIGFFALDQARGEQLFAARKYDEAREQFAALWSMAAGDARELIELRLAECDYLQKQYRRAADRLSPYLDHAARLAEARFFYLSSLRGLGQHDEYMRRARQLAIDFPDSSWTEEALNNLATHFVLVDDSAAALDVFREIVTHFPLGRFAERASWKLGWTAYREKRDEEAIAVFERAALHAPRSDYRPAWIYWAGRAHERRGDRALALERYEVAAYDYLNSYYGRLAARRLTDAGRVPGRLSTPLVAPATVTPNAAVLPAATQARIRALLSADLVDAALAEIQYAQRTLGTSSMLDATLAWALNRRGELRRAITIMKRAYPQYLTAAGERIPDGVQRVMFPVEYWALIQKYSAAHDLDPFMIAALIAQESTFQADAKSAANAWGLMQVLPSTGKHLARAERMRGFSTAKLTDPEVNVRLGTRYFAGLVDRFGGAHFALASYNAGESRVVRWQNEKPGIEREEFIDDIPFPETQNYVKRILGTADDYKRLYANARALSDAAHTSGTAAKAPATRKAPVPKAAPRKVPPKRGVRG